MSGAVHIGTSGWHYDHWKGPFYPQDLPAKKMLEYYARSFQTAEINNTFYQLPKKETLEQWRDTVPGNFIFAVKGSQYITHRKKLKDPQASLPNFLEPVKSLGQKLGPILFQLPPKWKANPQRLREFLRELPEDHRYAFELRDPDWFNESVTEALEESNAAFCIYDFAGRQSPRTLTADFVYIRLHGPDGAYQGKYEEGALKEWTDAITKWTDGGKDVYCYFDNDENGYAAQDALRLKSMLET